MTSQTAYLGAYWGAREEAISVSAVRLANTLVGLGQLSPLFKRWAAKGKRSEILFDSTAPDVAALDSQLQQGFNRKDVDSRPIVDLGVRWSAWNGHRDTGAAVSVHCGATATGVTNSLLINMPSPDATDSADLALYEPGAMADLVRVVVECWSPSWATVTSHRLRNSRRWLPGQPVVGWFTFLADNPPLALDLHVWNSSELLNGQLLQITEQWNQVRSRDINNLADSLEAAGALSPR